MIRERTLSTVSGWVMLPLIIIAMAFVGWLISLVPSDADGALMVAALILVEGVLAFLLAGFFVVNPNEARVATLFGKYSGQEFKMDGTDYLHMREDDIIGIVVS